MRTKTRLWESMFFIFIAALPFQTAFQFSISNTAVQLSDVVLAAGCFTWLLTAGRSFVWRPIHTLLAIFLTAMLLSALFSEDPVTSAIKLAGKASLAAAAFLSIEFTRAGRGIERLAAVWRLAASAVILLCLIGIAAYYSGLTDPAANVVVHPIFGSLPAGNYPRIEGFFAYPSVLCNYLGVSLWLTVIAAARHRKQVLTVLFFASLAITALFTFTPGLGGTLLALAVFLSTKFEDRRTLRPLLAAVGVAVAAAFLFVSTFTLFSSSPGGWQSPLLRGELSASHRAMAWESALGTFFADPILGKGVGLPTASAVYVDANGNRQLLADAHNTYINVLAETGIVGFIGFFAMVGWTSWKLLVARGESGTDKVICLCLTLALLDSFYYQGLTGSYEDQRHLWVLLGAAAGFVMGNDTAKIKAAPGEPEAA